MTVELTEKAKENLQRIAESRKKDSKFARLEPAEKTTLHFDAEKIEPMEVEFEGVELEAAEHGGTVHAQVVEADIDFDVTGAAA